MSFNTLQFFIFLAIGVIVYYVVPKKFRWIWLLILSYSYYFTFSHKTVVFMLFTTISVYVGGRLLTKYNKDSKEQIAANKETWDKEQKKAFKARIKRNKRRIVIVMLLLNFGMLGAVKYLNFFIRNIDALVCAIGHGQYIPPLALVLPIGISFYTFQSISYVIDVYQGKYEAEKNPFKFALFVSFFPQLLQGPIGRFDRLGHQLFEGNEYKLINIQYGLQRILWGLFKKVVLADRAAVVVSTVVDGYTTYGGFYNIFALLMYSIQLYADFSGGIDIVIGAAQMFGIKMDENFRQPYFSKSIGEFWRRWHISLGAWMKDYIFYPFSLSKAMNKFGKWSKKHFKGNTGKALPICLANLLIFFIVGVWHGAEWKFIFYGLYNGIIIAVSALLEPAYDWMFAKTHINKNSKPWQVVAILRTFILVNFGWFFDIGTDTTTTLAMIRDTFTNLHWSQLTSGGLLDLGLLPYDYAILAFGCIIVLIVSILKERGIVIREALGTKPLPVRWIAYYALIFMILFIGYTGVTQGFIYANF